MEQVKPHPSALFDECVRKIEVAYNALGHQLGWRFLCVGRSVLEAPVKVALITINPAGNHIPADHPWPSCESGVSYLVERWDGSLPGQSTLQVQVQGLFRMLSQNLAFRSSYQELMAQSLISHFVPFRSPRFADLCRQRESLEFGRHLWQRILSVVSPRLIVCFGREVQKELRTLIPIATGAAAGMRNSYETGWGHYMADIDEYSRLSGVVRLLYLPHLSRYQLFTSDKCTKYMPRIIHAACKDL